MSERVRFLEGRIPLEGIEETAEAVIELYGGRVSDRRADGVTFVLPQRRGVAAAGGVECRLDWEPDPDGVEGEGLVTLEAGKEITAPKIQTVLLLLVGSLGGLLFLLWPFFPDLGPILWVGGVLAIATFLLTLRISPGGVAADLLQRLARAQRERAMEEGEGSS
jgi:hypothetical protein